jgi:hypothetical protein
MRQVADTLVWFGLVSMVAAVIYFTPRLADYVSTMSADPSQESGPRSATAHFHHAGSSRVAR